MSVKVRMAFDQLPGGLGDQLHATPGLPDGHQRRAEVSRVSGLIEDLAGPRLEVPELTQEVLAVGDLGSLLRFDQGFGDVGLPVSDQRVLTQPMPVRNGPKRFLALHH